MTRKQNRTHQKRRLRKERKKANKAMLREENSVWSIEDGIQERIADEQTAEALLQERLKLKSYEERIRERISLAGTQCGLLSALTDKELNDLESAIKNDIKFSEELMLSSDMIDTLACVIAGEIPILMELYGQCGLPLKYRSKWFTKWPDYEHTSKITLLTGKEIHVQYVSIAGTFDQKFTRYIPQESSGDIVKELNRIAISNCSEFIDETCMLFDMLMRLFEMVGIEADMPDPIPRLSDALTEEHVIAWYSSCLLEYARPMLKIIFLKFGLLKSTREDFRHRFKTTSVSLLICGEHTCCADCCGCGLRFEDDRPLHKEMKHQEAYEFAYGTGDCY